jgi:protein gp37
MANKIEWLHLPGYTAETWNPITGCTKVSAGCANCWAEKMSKRMAGRYGYPASDPFKVTVHKDKFQKPFSWRNPRMVFVCSMGDLFHDDVPDNFINDVFNSIEAEENRKHLFLILTKRPKRMHELSGRWGPGAFPNNLWFGVSVENQDTANKRIPWLLRIPAEKRFISAEPLLERVSINMLWMEEEQKEPFRDELLEHTFLLDAQKELDWVIVGGESGFHARPMHPDWVRSIRDQCAQTGTPFFFKQWGAWIPNSQKNDSKMKYSEVDMMGSEMLYKVGKKAAGRVLDSEVYNQYPHVQTRFIASHSNENEKQEGKI